MIRLFLLSIHLSFPSLYFLHESLNQPLNQPTQIKTQPNPSHLTTPSTSHPLPPQNAIHILHALPIPYKANHEPGARSHEQKEIKTDIYLIYLSIHLPRCAIYLHIHAYTYKYIHIYTYNPIQSNPLQPTSLQPNPIQPNPLPYPTLPPHPSLSPPGFPQSRNPPACKFRR